LEDIRRLKYYTERVKVRNATLTILSDNRAREPFGVEHGFAVLLRLEPEEGEDFTVLFDTGRGTLLANAAHAGVDPADIRYLVLSHGHYDHTDSITDVLESAPRVVVCASRTVDIAHYSTRTGEIRDISLSPRSRTALACLPHERKILFDDRVSLDAAGARPVTGTGSPGPVFLAGNIPRLHPLEGPSPVLFADHQGVFPDIVPDEIVLWFNTPHGLVILTGCCHAGFINTCEYVRKLARADTIRAVVGGFHLTGGGQERLESIREYMIDHRIPLLVPSHCTGDAETAWLSAALGPAVVQPGFAGKSCMF
jgi:7,8-dihydropterin-6-yl-methyl-4-(beta-D-ribofuranosyl)aminobenzene 5'-phosphate synthase